MEKLTTTTLFTILALCIFISTPNTSARTPVEEKVARIKVYAHDYFPGSQDALEFSVANASITTTSSTDFGAVWVADKFLTVAPDEKSTEVGRWQGLVVWSDMKVRAVSLNMNFVFTSGEYNGSTISVAGRYEEAPKEREREQPIVGGTGRFRLARGYVLSKTHSYDVSKNHAVLECEIYAVYCDVRF